MYFVSCYVKIEVLQNPGMALGNIPAPHLNGIRHVAAPRIACYIAVQPLAVLAYGVTAIVAYGVVCQCRCREIITIYPIPVRMLNGAVLDGRRGVVAMDVGIVTAIPAVFHRAIVHNR